MNCPVCIFSWTWTIQHANCWVVSPSWPREPWWRLLSSLSRSGGALPEASADHHWHLHRPARGRHHVCGGLLQNQVNIPSPATSLLTAAGLHCLVLMKREGRIPKGLFSWYFVLNNPFRGCFLTTYIRKLCLFVWLCSEDFWSLAISLWLQKGWGRRAGWQRDTDRGLQVWVFLRGTWWVPRCACHITAEDTCNLHSYSGDKGNTWWYLKCRGSSKGMVIIFQFLLIQFSVHILPRWDVQKESLRRRIKQNLLWKDTRENTETDLCSLFWSFKLGPC